MTHGIDANSGDIIAAEGVLSPQLTRSRFIKSDWFDSGDWSNESEGWYAASAKPLTINGEPFGASLLFQHERLVWISLLSADPRFGSDRDDWSEAKERERNAKHHEWLDRTLGRWKKPFSWGQVSAGYDSKSGGSSITIEYFDGADAPSQYALYEDALEFIRREGFVEDKLVAAMQGKHRAVQVEQISEACRAMKHLVDTAEELAELHRRGSLFSRNAQRELRQRHPGYKTNVYDSAWAHGLFITR